MESIDSKIKQAVAIVICCMVLLYMYFWNFTSWMYLFVGDEYAYLAKAILISETNFRINPFVCLLYTSDAADE